MESQGMAGHFIRRLHQSATQIFLLRTKEAGFDITAVQFASMDALKTHPGIDQATVAALIAYDRVTIGGVIDRLVAKGWVERTVSKTDRRAHVVTLTPEGDAAFMQASPIVKTLQYEILGELEPSERQIFIQLATKALGSIAKSEDADR